METFFLYLKIFLEISRTKFMSMKEFFSTYILPSGVLFTFIATCVNIYYTRQSSKKSKYIDTITSERIKWLSLIRNEISEIISIISETLIFYSEEINNIESQNPDENYIADTNYKFQIHYFDSQTRKPLKFKDHVEYENIIKRLYILKLRFNPLEDQDILYIIQYFIKFYNIEFKSKADITEAQLEIENLVKNTQSLLKNEWEKVKSESEGKFDFR